MKKNTLWKKRALCNKCKLPISFKKLSSGKYCPTNVDGTEHFDLCRDEQYRQGKRKPMMISSRWITGIQHVPSICNCDVPPWESCEHYNDDILDEDGAMHIRDITHA